MFEDWPEVLRKLGTPRSRHWWQELWERGEDVVDKTAMEET
jgi:hypothetical protein